MGTLDMNSQQLDEDAVFDVARKITDAAAREMYLAQIYGTAAVKKLPRPRLPIQQAQPKAQKRTPSRRNKANGVCSPIDSLPTI